MLWFILGYAVILIISWIRFFTADAKHMDDKQFRDRVRDYVILDVFFLAQIALSAFYLICKE